MHDGSRGVWSCTWSYGSQFFGDKMSGSISKDSKEVRSMTKGMSRSNQNFVFGLRSEILY